MVSLPAFSFSVYNSIVARHTSRRTGSGAWGTLYTSGSPAHALIMIIIRVRAGTGKEDNYRSPMRISNLGVLYGVKGQYVPILTLYQRHFELGESEVEVRTYAILNLAARRSQRRADLARRVIKLL